MKTNKLNTEDSVVNKKFAEEDKKVISYPRMEVEDYPNGESNIKRNLGVEFQKGKIANISINRSAIERRCANYGVRRSIKKQQQAAWLLKAITLIDLTTLSGDDTEARVRSCLPLAAYNSDFFLLTCCLIHSDQSICHESG